MQINLFFPQTPEVDISRVKQGQVIFKGLLVMYFLSSPDPCSLRIGIVGEFIMRYSSQVSGKKTQQQIKFISSCKAIYNTYSKRG